MKTPKSALLDTTRQPTTEKCLSSLFSVNIFDCRPNRSIPVKISQLKPSFNDTERISKHRTNYPRRRRYDKILNRRHVLFLKIPQPRKINVTTYRRLHRSSHQSLVKTLIAIFLVYISARTHHVAKNVAPRMKCFESVRRNHQSHFDIFERLKQDCGCDSTYQSIDSVFVYHFKKIEPESNNKIKFQR